MLFGKVLWDYEKLTKWLGLIFWQNRERYLQRTFVFVCVSVFVFVREIPAEDFCLFLCNCLCICERDTCRGLLSFSLYLSLYLWERYLQRTSGPWKLALAEVKVSGSWVQAINHKLRFHIRHDLTPPTIRYHAGKKCYNGIFIWSFQLLWLILSRGQTERLHGMN